MKTKVFYTNNDWTGTIIRLATAIVLLPHGAQKLLGMFGGFGFTGTMEYLTETFTCPGLSRF